MRVTSFMSISLACALATSVSAQRLNEQCQALYDEITADVPLDIDSCTPVVPALEFDACDAPAGFNGELPASHLILAIDASGSMAGQIDGESKMNIAKREALEFLQSLDENISVGLVVYGHLGNNQQDGKAESCASSEMIHGFDADRDDLVDTIASLSPTGWTPMGGVLDYAGSIIAELPEPRSDEPALAPVIYMISDGEETCDGDPVAVAQNLYENGVRTTINTIGFAVDSETQAQLQAIADAGGGTYYPAESGGVLRRQLREIAQAERDIITYEQCVQQNANSIYFAFTPITSESMRCYNANDPSGLLTAVMNARNEAPEGDPLFEECGNKMVFQASEERSELGQWVTNVLVPFGEYGRQLQDEYLTESGFPPRHE